MIKIILVEDHPIVRNGIKGLLEVEDDIQVVGLVANGLQALDLLASGIEADVVLTDINMPQMDGMELLAQLKIKYPNIPVILLSMLDSEKLIFDAFELGAAGYVLKNATGEELIFCIRQVASGVQVVCSEIGIKLLKRASMNRAANTTFELSERELEILELISQGLTNQQIADKVFASRRTVEGHRQAMVLRAGVKNTAELVRFACKNGLI